MKTFPSLVFLLLFSSLGNSQETTMPPLEVVREVDLDRYMGKWYEIARLPNPFQKSCSGDVTATYVMLDNGEVQVVNRCRKRNGEMSEANGLARIAHKDGPNSRLKVRFAPSFLSFLPFVWGDYWIIMLDPDYTYAVVGEPQRRYLWVLSRTPRMDEPRLQKILAEVELQGYDLTGLVRTEQTVSSGN